MNEIKLTKDQRERIAALDAGEVGAIENAVFVFQNARHYSTSKLVAAGRLLRSHGLHDICAVKA